MATRTAAKTIDASFKSTKTAFANAKTEVAKTPKIRSRGKAKTAEPVERVAVVKPTAKPVLMESIWPPEGVSKATNAEVASVSAVNDKVTTDPHWSHRTDGIAILSEADRTQASMEYALFREKNPEAAAKYTEEQYVAFRQTKNAERLAKATEPGKTAPEQATAQLSDVLGEKHWSRQASFDEMSADQKAAAAVDYARFAEKKPNAAKKHDLSSYANYVIDRSAENRSLGLGLRRCEANLDRGAVLLADSRQADAFLKEAYSQKRTGVDALRNLQQSVEPGQSRTEDFKGTFSLTVERSKDNKIVRTTLTPIAGKESVVKELFGAAAAKSFARARSEPKVKQIEKQQQQDMGR
jgi:uncharacterized protein YchJ